MERSKCRSCGADIIWAKTANGKNMPIDAEPSADGTFVIVDGVAFTGYTMDAQEKRQFHKSHFATCPNADYHRRGKKE